MTNTDYQEEILKAVHKVFPESFVGVVVKFSKGLTSNVYKVEIHNPEKTLAIKFFLKKIQSNVEKSKRLTNYVRENNVPSAHTYYLVNDDEDGWFVMDCLPGFTTLEAWETSAPQKRYAVLINSEM